MLKICASMNAFLQTAMLLALSACSLDIVEAHYPLEPPAIYRDWFYETVRCAGSYTKHIEYDKLRFYVVIGSRFAVGDKWAIGAERNGDIWLTFDSQFDKRVVKHEMMHYITGFNTHPEIFKTCHLLNN